MPSIAIANRVAPRVLHLAERYVAAADGRWSPETLLHYTEAVQEHEPLLLFEVLLLPTSVELAQLELVLSRAEKTLTYQSMPSIENSPFSASLDSLRRARQFEWQLLLEEIVPFNRQLAEDPTGTFAGMEYETRALYRVRVAELAAHSDVSEVELAAEAPSMAREMAGHPSDNPRMTRRRAHIGYFLFEEGFELLAQRIGYQAPFKVRIRQLLRKNNAEFYIFGIYVLSILLIAYLIMPLVPHHEFLPVMGVLLLALLPATQGASDLVNNAVTAIMPAHILPKLDFSKGIREEHTTLVAVPTLLLDRRQVEKIFEDLEIRYLANEDPNLHFAVLTDLPDSVDKPRFEDRNALVEFAVRMTDALNAKYGSGPGGGSFLLLHRHRIFNRRQGVWMGWERKRGKLVDLNKLLLGEFDSFPVKAGPIDVLRKVRYIITLDSDTQLPRGTAARLVGAMAHPLNQGIIDPRKRIVTAGYGILQPRIGVSVSSASRSRFAALYSGETGFDIYSRAVSDVYQDLFGEGIFTGKGIYEVSIFHQVLDHRFPRNALLSHDLIEGSYTRVGLATDIELIDDYPSHYSAHTRRKHRWMRGDWQITQWLFSEVPDESGKLTANPISTISRWKIFDNLRRSLIEPVTFLLLVFGWFFLPGGARYWTVVTLALMLVPVFVQLGFKLGRAALKLSVAEAIDSLRTFFSSLGFELLTLVFILHQTLLSLDAITRSLVRRFVTGKRLLEWETAAQAETGRTRSALDRYLQLCPVISLGFAGLIATTHRNSFVVAGPVLLLWALAPAISGWLNSPPRPTEGLSDKERDFLLQQALLIWRYFANYGGEKNHWLIPDNVEEKGLHQVRMLSPTNLGMLLNARQGACELGLITLPEFAHLTLQTLSTFEQLEKLRGHIYNWYDIETLKPLPPLMISTVDSGNLAASLYTLHGGARDLLKRPLLEMKTIETLVWMLENAEHCGSKSTAYRSKPTNIDETVAWVIDSPEWDEMDSSSEVSSWHSMEIIRRRKAIIDAVTGYTPWLQPRFASIIRRIRFADDVRLEEDSDITLEHTMDFVRSLETRLSTSIDSVSESESERALAIELRMVLQDAIVPIEKLVEDVRRIAFEANRHAEAMHYDFLFVESRRLLSIGYDGGTNQLHPSCYDLLASEARIAYFLAIAAGDISQEAWFKLDRTHVLVDGRAALMSWTGTMFEYMMPALWMRNYPNTLISRTLESAATIQRRHTRGIPWGISESGFAKTDQQGRYQYYAWGIPDLAMKYGVEDGPVISPYSTYLTISFGQKEALANLHRMTDSVWAGQYGLYEAADFSGGGDPQLVRSWMAHHQGMSLLAITNAIRGDVFKRWFHENPKVRASELLLHERPLSRQSLNDLHRTSASAVGR